MSDQSIDITPDTHFLESIRADRGLYWALLAEGVDNSFDANANDVALSLRKDGISLRDSGVGITRDRETAIVRLGEHRAMPTTMLGAFGIGLKYHAVSAGNVLEVESVSVDGRMSLRADWQQVIRSGQWKIPPPIWVPAVRPGQTFTQVKIRDLRWPSPTAKDLRQAFDKLAQLFYPALASGRRITLNDEPLPVLVEPPMRSVVEGFHRLTSGKGAHVRGGMIIDPKTSPLYSVQVSYKHRVIMPQSTFGCGSYTGLRRMFARVELTGPWSLTRFKNGLADSPTDEAELHDAILDILRPVLEQCHSAQMSMQVKEMTALLNEMLPSELQPARPPRSTNRTPRPRTKPPGPPHGITDTGSVIKDGPARKSAQGRGLVISFDEPMADDYGYGQFQEGRPNRIVLARDNPHVRTLLEHRDKTIGAQSLYALAAMIFRHEQPLTNSQIDIPFEGPFGLQAWQMVAQQEIRNEDDKDVA